MKVTAPRGSISSPPKPRATSKHATNLQPCGTYKKTLTRARQLLNNAGSLAACSPANAVCAYVASLTSHLAHSRVEPESEAA